MQRLLVSLVLLVTSILALPLDASAQQAVINVNTATVEQLDQLPGIGPSRAAAIITARARRPFRRLADLLRVPGIGRTTLERLAPFVCFEDLVPSGPPSASTGTR